MPQQIFTPADILLPSGIDLTAFSVIACDQFTSEPDYWAAVKNEVADKPSALQLIFPEIELKTVSFSEKISSINSNMHSYLSDGILTEHKNTLVYLERTLRNGSKRRGLVGKIDLEGYSYHPDAQTPIRATEGTVLERIPPRVQIRKDAPLELPHVMLLIDDAACTVLEPLSSLVSDSDKAYSFALMQESGSINGWIIPPNLVIRTLEALDNLSKSKYGLPPLQYAVGDGNHSLATAKQCYEELKQRIGSNALNHPSRYALCEVVNLHDPSLAFEAIHRILFNVDIDSLLSHLKSTCGLSYNEPCNDKWQSVVIAKNGKTTQCFLTKPLHTLAVGTLQIALDEYMSSNRCEIDYIHGDDVVVALSQTEDSIGFILPNMDKADLFKTVILDGALPRKTFSMGHAWDKRFYFEARKIK